MAHEQMREVEALLAAAADRTRGARAELAAAAHELFRPATERLTDQQRALIGDVLTKLVDGIELELRRVAGDRLGIGGGETAMAAAELAAAGLLSDPALLRRAVQRAEEHRLSLIAADSSVDVAGGANLIEALARNPDAELARRAVAYVVGEARRRDRFREPLLLCDDLPAADAYRLYWRIAAVVRRDWLARHVVEASDVEAALEDAVREAMADHADGQGSAARAGRLAARLAELGELTDDFLTRSLVQGHLALFAAGLATRAQVGADIVWQAIADRGRASLLVLFRAIGVSDAGAATAIELLDAGQPLARAPSAQRALLAAYDRIARADAERVLRGWQLDAGFRDAIGALDPDRLR